MNQPPTDPVEWHERAVIGTTMAMETGPYPAAILALESEHFSVRNHAVIWTAIAELIGRGDPTDAVAVYGVLIKHGHNGHGHLLARLTWEHITTAGVDHHAKQVWEAGQQRLLRSRINDIVERGSGGSFEEISTGVLDAVRNAERFCDNRGLVHVRQPMAEALTRLEKVATDPDALRCCRTGLADVDDQLTIENGSLTIVAGRPSMGKTAFAVGIARECSRDLTKGSVAIFSLEMSAVSLAIRLLAREARVPVKMLTNPRRQPQIAAALDRLSKSGLYLDDRGAIGPDEMSSTLARLGRVRLVVVDYLQLTRTSNAIDRHDLKIGAVTKGMKAIAKAHNCAVILLSQLNRRVEDRKPPRPLLSDLRDSGSIEEDADNVIMLYRGEYYDKTTSKPGVAEVMIVKQRGGPTADVEVAWMPEIQTFADLSRRD